MSIIGSTTSVDREKMLAGQLVARSYLKMVAKSLCDKENMKEGAGETAYFVRYKRMNVPLVPLSDDGLDPADSSFELEEFTVALDEWGDVITITTRAKLTTKHPLLAQAMELLADNAARVMDREVQLVWLAGTNVRYGDGTVASRATVTKTMRVSEDVILGSTVQLADDGAPPRGGPAGDAKQVQAEGTFQNGQAYIGVCGPQVHADLMRAAASFGTWAAVATYANAKALYNAEVGTWLGVRWVVTNFIPKFVLLGNKTTAVTTGNTIGVTGLTVTTATSGGALTDSTTYYYKVTRKDLLRGFEEAISIEHTTATGAAATADDNLMTFAFPSTAGFVYSVYFGSATGDSNLKRHATYNIAASGSLAVSAVPSTTVTAPANIRAANDSDDPTTIHPIFYFAAMAVKWVGFYDTRFEITPDVSTPGNVLRRRRQMGYGFFGKAALFDQIRLLRNEVSSFF